MQANPSRTARLRVALGWLAALAAAATVFFLLLHLPEGRSFFAGHRTLLRHVSVYEPDTKTLLLDRDLLWQDGRLRAAGPGGSLDPRGALVVEGAGLCAVPALADAAVFLSLEGRYPGVSVPSTTEDSLRAEARCGVAGLLDLNADRSFIRASRILDADPALPQAHFAGALFAAPGGWRVSGQTPWVANIAEVQEDADLAEPWTRILHFGDQAVFASVDGGTDELAIPLPVLEHLGALAHARDLPFIIQTNSARKAERALAAKPDALLGPLFDLDEAPALPEELRAADCAYIPALGSVMNAFPPEPMAAWLKGFPAAQNLEAPVRKEIEDPDNAAVWAQHWTRRGVVPSKLLETLHGLAAGGVRLAFGTGSGLPLVFHGLGAQMEIAQWLRAGLDPTQILWAATLGSRALIGLDGGHLSKGEPADLLLVRGDPRQDPQTVAHPLRVFLGGVEVRR